MSIRNTKKTKRCGSLVFRQRIIKKVVPQNKKKFILEERSNEDEKNK